MSTCYAAPRLPSVVILLAVVFALSLPAPLGLFPSTAQAQETPPLSDAGDANATAQPADIPQENAYIHFFVAPVQARDGVTLHEELIALKKMLINTAGGYTELGASHGGSLQPNGHIARQDNISFVVAAREDLSEQIATFLSIHFQEKQPFILVMRGNCSLY